MRFENLKNDILGKDYSLSIACVSKTKSREINKKYRKKDKPTNVLSFSLSKDLGELILCKSLIQQEAKLAERNFEEYFLSLVIHGVLHLKGMKHGSTMEKAENLYFAKYDQKHFDRHRSRLLRDPGRRGRILKRRKKS